MFKVFLKSFFLLLFVFLSVSCSTFYSGSDPKSILSEDRKIVDYSKLYLNEIPLVVDQEQKHKTRVYVYAFDGTDNDQNNIDTERERETIVGSLANTLKHNGFKVEYEKGPGNGSISDSVFCTSCLPKAKKALEDLKKKLATDGTRDAEAHIKVVVLGFSRGAAIARHFMNLVSETWPLHKEKHSSGQSVRSYGVLFDTVATSVKNELILGIAPTTDYLVHFVSRDERRVFFPAVLDKDLAFSPYEGTPDYLKRTPRLTELTLPGAHSDVGGSYKSGIGTFYHALGKMVLNDYGLIGNPSIKFNSDFYSKGFHDSRGIFDRFIDNFFDFNESRSREVVKSIPISADRAFEIKERNSKNFNKSGSYFEYKETPPIVLNVFRNETSLEVSSPDEFIKNIEHKQEGDKLHIFYDYLSAKDLKISLDNELWDLIPKNKSSRIELVTLKKDKRNILEIYINRRLVKKIVK